MVCPIPQGDHNKMAATKSVNHNILSAVHCH